VAKENMQNHFQKFFLIFYTLSYILIRHRYIIVFLYSVPIVLGLQLKTKVEESHFNTVTGQSHLTRWGEFLLFPLCAILGHQTPGQSCLGPNVIIFSDRTPSFLLRPFSEVGLACPSHCHSSHMGVILSPQWSHPPA
jgi:hypothetical protein